MTTAAVELLLTPLDRARVRVYRALGGFGTHFVRRRELRVAVLGCGVVLASLLGALLLPLWLLALGPIVWGTPHLLSDVRYMVVRRGYHRRRLLWVAAGAPLALTAVEGGMLYGLLATALVLVVARASGVRRLLGLSCVALVALGAHRLGPARDIVFAHAHNFIAVGLWWLWRRRTGSAHSLVVLLFGLATLFIALGGADRLIYSGAALTLSPAGLDLGKFFWELVPGVRGPLAVRLVLLFAFAQAVHYGIWIRLIPEEDRPRETPRSFRATYRALEADFGRFVLWAVALSGVAFAGWAVYDLAEARSSYLRFAIFHGHLELAAFALWWAEKKGRA